MTTWIFILLMIFFCVTDIRNFHISNWVVLPAIGLGIFFTGHWLPALVMFIVGALLFQEGNLAGGDVKLMTMTGAFLGWWSIPAFLISKVFVFYYRTRNREIGVLPYAPFLFIGSWPFLFVK